MVVVEVVEEGTGILGLILGFFFTKKILFLLVQSFAHW